MRAPPTPTPTPTPTLTPTPCPSRERLSSLTFNGTGDWIAVGAAALGQLLVWEWRSETYVLKQQGHYYDVSTAAFSPDGAYLVTGADDAKVGRGGAHGSELDRGGGGGVNRSPCKHLVRVLRCFIEQHSTYGEGRQGKES